MSTQRHSKVAPKSPSSDAQMRKKTNGAPLQLSQSSRKGKRAWRKNVDIVELEDRLESLRDEERATGTMLHKQKDEHLFQVDVIGDEKIRRVIRSSPAKQLTSTKILAQRSAVPAVISRTLPSSKHENRAKLSQKEKTRLFRITKRHRSGPFNTAEDSTTFGNGSALLEISAAVKSSGHYDAWAPAPAIELAEGLETVYKPLIKRPKLDHPRDIIEIPAVDEPHLGISYNPPVDAHTELIIKAANVEQQLEKEAEALKRLKEKIHGALDSSEPSSSRRGEPLGMIVDDSIDDEKPDANTVVDQLSIAKKAPRRKTQQQKAKAARNKTERQNLADKAAKKRLLNNITLAKTYRHEILRQAADSEATRLQRAQTWLQKQKLGLAGHRLGKHRVPEIAVDVQLGEDLSESLRALKPEGNLFRDRFHSMQQRALIEPRVPVMPTRRLKIKEYEKHAYKRFV